MRNGGFEPSCGYIRVRPAIGGHAGFHGRQGRCFVEKSGSAALHGEAATRASVMGVRRCQVSATLTGAHVLLHTFGEHQMMTGAATHESGAAQRCGILPTRTAVSVEAFRAPFVWAQLLLFSFAGRYGLSSP